MWIEDRLQIETIELWKWPLFLNLSSFSFIILMKLPNNLITTFVSRVIAQKERLPFVCMISVTSVCYLTSEQVITFLHYWISELSNRNFLESVKYLHLQITLISLGRQQFFTVSLESAGEAVKTSVTAGKAVFSSKKLRRDWLEAKKNLTRCEEREKGT